MKCRILQILCALCLLVGCHQTPRVITKHALEVYDEELDRALGTLHQTQQAENAEITPQGKKSAPKDYTIMIYMIGSNLESRYGAATNDLQEIASSGVDFRKTNVIVYTGGARRWNSDISAEYNSILDMAKTGEKRVVAKTAKASDMGAPETLAHFLTYCVDYYPAKHYGLICWDHGGGPLWGYGSDELYDYDSLALEEIRAAMKETPFNTERKLDFIGYDACLMGSVESAVLWAPYADYLVASEEVEAGAGWDYSFLKTLNKTQETKAVVTAIVETFASYYQAHESAFSHPDATLAAIDLAHTQELVTCVDALSHQMQSRVQDDFHSIAKARSQAKSFGLSVVDHKSEGYDLIDLADFAKQLGAEYRKEAKQLKTVLASSVVALGTNVADVCGLSIYCPGDNKALYRDALSMSYKEIAVSDTYLRFVGAYCDRWLDTASLNWSLGTLKRQGQAYTLQLTPSQQNVMTKATYTILRRQKDRYYATSSYIHITPDSQGLLRVPYDPEVFLSVSDEGASEKPWTFMQCDDNETTEIYRSDTACFLAISDFEDQNDDLDAKAHIVIKKDKKTSQVDVSAVYETSVNGDGGKNTIDTSRYHSLACLTSYYKMSAHHDDGSLDAFDRWQKAGGLQYFYVPFNETFAYQTRHVSSLTDDYYVQVVITDMYGETHGTDLVRLKGNTSQQTSVKTAQGTLSFIIDNDQAVLRDYEGEDEVLTIPERVNGHPVTAIGSHITGNKTTRDIILPKTVKTLQDHAFEDFKSVTSVTLNEGLETIEMQALACPKLTAVHLPQSLRTIGRGAFKRSAITSLHIPEKTDSIAKGAFIYMNQLTGFTADAKNPSVRVVDGVLYTKDGKTLLSYPNKKGTSYQVAEGTKTIAYGAFARTDLTAVTLPEGLEVIDNAAFFRCEQLSAFTLPQSLTTIGTKAFGGMDALLSLSTSPEIERLEIGPNVSLIGPRAFNNLHVKHIDVDANNAHYASLEGFLTNKMKDTLLEAPLGRTQIVTVPEGITTLTKGVFRNYPKQTQFVLPDSLYRFSVDTFTYTLQTDDLTHERIKTYETTLHCSEGSASEAYAKRYHIAYDDDLEISHHQYTEKDITQDGVTYTCRLYDDHAVIAGIKKQARVLGKTLVLPEEVDGRKVTSMIYTASYQRLYLIDTLILPPSLQTYDVRLNQYFPVKAYQIAPDNDNFVTVDGVLYQHDQSILYAYPEEKLDDGFTVPDATHTIASYAFYRQRHLSHIRLSDQLQHIGAYGFAYSVLTDVTWNAKLETIEAHAFTHTALTTLPLPDEITLIGDHAFSYLAGYQTIHLPSALNALGSYAFYSDQENLYGHDDVLRLPASLTTFAASSFRGMAFTSFDVREHEGYQASGSLLLDASGKHVVACAPGVQGKVVIPEGVEIIDAYAFTSSPYVTEIICPDSLRSLAKEAFPAVKGQYKIRLHFKTNNDVVRQAKAMGLPVIIEQ